MPRRSIRKQAKGAAKFGALPQWNLDDLYPGMDSPALQRDLEGRRMRLG